LSDVSTIFIPTKNITAKKVFIYIISEIIFYCNIDLKYEINKKTKTFQVTQKYQNGKGVIIPMSEIEDRENGNFILSITTNEEYKERKVEVGLEVADEGDNVKTEIEILDHKYGATLDGENCYKLKSNSIKNATMLINIYSQYLTFNVKKENEIIYSKDIFNNNFIRIQSKLLESENYFCLKKFTQTQNGEKEKLGLTSYDFQIYYDDEIIHSQPFIMPLINGQTYVHSLLPGDFVYYRHNSNINVKDKNYIYTSNLLEIKGKNSNIWKTFFSLSLYNRRRSIK
jgi:hypothetical protein